MINLTNTLRIVFFFIIALGAIPISTSAQHSASKGLQGKVLHLVHGKKVPLRQATVMIKDYGASTTTDRAGQFSFPNLPSGSVLIHISYLGKVDVDTTITLPYDSTLEVVLLDRSYRLETVDVLAQNVKGSSGTSSKIGQSAIEHLQANSLIDLMSLLPGGLTENSDLTNAKQISIRSLGNSTLHSNSFGTSIVVNGSPLSNNANLQSLNPVVSGGGSSMSGGSAPDGGFDVRNIPIQNIESVEIIRGVPSVEYGDVTSGTVIVNQKAGRQPITIEARTNPKLYSIQASSGFQLPNDKGVLNLGTDYTHNTANITQSHVYYERATLNGLYSNRYLYGRLNTNTGLNLTYGKDTRKQNPDDEITKTRSHGKDLSVNFNTNGSLSFDRNLLKQIKYSASVNYSHKDSYLHRQYTSATAPYSMTYTDGTVLTNRPGLRLYDIDGHEITNIPIGSEHLYAVYLPATYEGEYNIDGKEFSTYGKATLHFANVIGNSRHKWVLGSDIKYDKNFGRGTTYADSLPPGRSSQYVNATFRKRKYRDIPGFYQFGFFAEDNMQTQLAGHALDITAGVRYDYFLGGHHSLSPRINASLEVIPNKVKIRGAYGLLAKAPSLLYLEPDNAYFEYININELATSSIPEDERNFMTTTRVFRTKNDNLKIAKNRKTEAGLDISVQGSNLYLTAFTESLKNGYSYGYTTASFQPVEYIEYKRSSPSTPTYVGTSHPVLAKFNMPSNSLAIDKKGIEAELDLKRIDAIRTKFNLSGAYIWQKQYSTEFNYYDGQSSTGPAQRTHIGLYDPAMTTNYDKSVVTSLRTVHNIPRIGFVITLTTEAIWNKSDWTRYGNDSIPLYYISKLDGSVNIFNRDHIEEKEFKEIIRPVHRPYEVVESLPTYFNFNINITKEIKNFMKVSFYANNMFRHYPIAQSKRIKSEYVKRNIPFYFGFSSTITL